MRIVVWGAGSIYDAALRVCARHGVEIVEDPAASDVLLLANYTRMVKADVRSLPRHGALCFHPSSLPRHRGRDAVYWTVKMGDPTCGASWFWIDDGIDTGEIAAVAELARPPEMRARELYEEVLVPLGESLLDAILKEMTRGFVPRYAQDESRATYEPPRPKPTAVAGER